MAGVNLTISQTGFDKVASAFKQLSDRGDDLQPAMSAIGEYLLGSNQDRMEQGITPSGEAFAPLSDVTIARKNKNQTTPLIHNGYLFNLVYQATSEAMELGTPMIYGAVMFYGAKQGEFGRVNNHPVPWGDIPAREYLGISSADEDEIAAIVGDFLLAGIGE
ncbi:phage virion morphogenesis protein [Shewanella avicenniae]|uniref:Phage virion morphogenesis protein n=1 Tax=Shewanella avicenniae TaxID=2814294 RepID=A0ABX7QPI0_9GAMM|nr:phage virion morphogenesis protein [Shewanella avicenniae]QSX32616.1 phage virion morphogenesis protein [Shewanella avicenniae]